MRATSEDPAGAREKGLWAGREWRTADAAGQIRVRVADGYA